MTTLDRAIAILHDRTARGVQSYGGTLDETRPTAERTLEHAIEEAADLLLYLIFLRENSTSR